MWIIVSTDLSHIQLDFKSQILNELWLRDIIKRPKENVVKNEKKINEKGDRRTIQGGENLFVVLV